MNVFHRLLKSMGNLFTILRTSRLRLITWSKSNKSAISKTKEFYLRLRTLLSKMNASHMYLQGLNSSENFCNTKALIKIDDLFSSNFFKTMPEIYFNGKSQFLSYGDFSCGEQACGEMPGYPAATPSLSNLCQRGLWYIKVQRNMHKRIILILRKLLYFFLNETLVILFHNCWIPVTFKFAVSQYCW